jgi:hypothetical protein
MRASLVHTSIDPDRISEAARLAELELVPAFLTKPGARHGYWMGQRSTGRLIVLTLWDDDAHMQAAWNLEHARLEASAKRVGARIGAPRAFDVAGAYEEAIGDAPRVRWVRMTQVSGCRSERRAEIPALFWEVVPTQVRTSGFCASYWLLDPVFNAALGFSFWEEPAQIRDSESSSARRRRRIEAVLGCTVEAVEEFEALCVASTVAPTPPSTPGRRRADQAASAAVLSELGTRLERPPGTVLAVPGETTDQIVILLDGGAAVTKGAEATDLQPGDHFGGRRIRRRGRHDWAMMTTTPSRLSVMSRLEFNTLEHTDPDMALTLVEGDAEPQAPGEG